ncbi:MAG TPA: hypothetical protein VKZ56_01760 [Membranihabitans sp.]|nr:hypothetical protein [Membranihabitans sp.]
MTLPDPSYGRLRYGHSTNSSEWMRFQILPAVGSRIARGGLTNRLNGCASRSLPPPIGIGGYVE